MTEFSHLKENGELTMVDVGHKEATERVAVASAVVSLNAGTMQLLRNNALPKGDALACAKVAGILAAKRTGELIPLCHPIALSFVDVRFEIAGNNIYVTSEARCVGQTGVEMEAIIAAQIASATIYDMCKAVQKDIVIHRTRLLHKRGGKSGEFNVPGFPGNEE